MTNRKLITAEKRTTKTLPKEHTFDNQDVVLIYIVEFFALKFTVVLPLMVNHADAPVV